MVTDRRPAPAGGAPDGRDNDGRCMVPIKDKRPRRAVLRRKPMKIAVSSTGPELDDLVDPRFGRCSYYVVVDPETLSFEAVPNEGRSMQ